MSETIRGWFAVIALTIILIPITILSVKSLKKEDRGKLDALYHQLTQLGVKVSIVTDSRNLEKLRVKLSQFKSLVGTIAINEKDIDYVLLTYVDYHRGGRKYFLEYIVGRNGASGLRPLKNTEMMIKRNIYTGGLIDFIWKGDYSLSQHLASDSELKTALVFLLGDGTLTSIQIKFPSKQGFAAIRTPYVLPALDWLEVPRLIAGHIKSI